MNIHRLIITPEQAKTWLETKNTSNRKLRIHHAEYLASAIKNGDFKTTHQGIAFSKSGLLLDGQHRLAAIVIADKAVEMVVHFDLDDDAFICIDQGLKRSIAEVTNIEKKQSEVARAALAYVTRKPSPEQVLRLYDSAFGENVKLLHDYCNSASTYYSSAQVRIAAVCHLVNGKNKDYILQTYRSLVLMNLYELPSIGLNLVKQVNTGIAKPGIKADQLSRSLKVFDYNNKDLSKIQINDDVYAASIKYVKETITNLIQL